jgi:hypothetical protein
MSKFFGDAEEGRAIGEALARALAGDDGADHGGEDTPPDGGGEPPPKPPADEPRGEAKTLKNQLTKAGQCKPGQNPKRDGCTKIEKKVNVRW